MAGEDNRPLHLVFFPYLARSHMIPMLETARLASERGGVKVSFVTTPANVRFLRPTADRNAAMEIHIIHFPGAEFNLPDGVENLTDVPPDLGVQVVTAAFHLQTSPALDALLSSLHPVDALISDALYPLTTSLAAKHGFPRLIFQVTGLFPLCAADVIDLYGLYKPDTPSQFSLPGFPDSVRLTSSELPEVFKHPVMLHLLREAEHTSYGVIVNSFEDLERDYAEMYRKLGPREVFLVGPVGIAGDRSPASSCSPRHQCLDWLDLREEGSVVYLGFGTMCRLSVEQMRQLAIGLADSGCGFLWAVSGGESEEWLPEGLEEKVKGRGLMWRGWAPQEAILNHAAVGGFVTHCGWNSVTEAVCAGVPMLTWPLHSEQFVIEKLLVRVLRVAAMTWEGPKSVVEEGKVVVPSAAVSAAVRGLLAAAGEEGSAPSEMRRRLRKLGEAGRRAVAEGGSSYRDLGRLIEGLYARRHLTAPVPEKEAEFFSVSN